MLDLRDRPPRSSTADPGGPSRHQPLERQLRADARLNAATRLCWLLTALSHRYGSAYMAVERMARELCVSQNTVRTGLKKLVKLGLFEREPRVGKHRPNKYRRARPPPGAVPDGLGDKPAFVRWVRRQRRLHLPTRAAWLLADLSAHDGHAEISMAEVGAQLDANEKNAGAAVGRLLDLGMFVREPAVGRGHRNRYRPVGHMAEIVTPATPAMGETTPDPPDLTPANFYEDLLEWQKVRHHRN